MKVESIKRILENHLIECHYQDHQLAALMEVCVKGVATVGEWKLFDDSDEREDVLEWLGY